MLEGKKSKNKTEQRELISFTLICCLKQGAEQDKAGINLGSKAIGLDIGKKIINKGIDNIPNIFKFGRSKIKNKNIKKALKSEIADMVVGEVKDQARKKYNSTNLIS